MNATAYAGCKGHRGSLYLIAVAVAALQASAFSATEEQGNTAYLDYALSAQPLRLWAINISPEPKAFQKEPDTAGRKVSRGSLYFGARSEQATSFLWDYTKGKLYLDLNRNRDLTDDPEGTLSCPVSRFNYYYQSFTNAPLKVTTPRGTCPLSVDLNLYAPEGGRISGSAALRSYWEAKIRLNGQDYQVGKADEPSKLGLDNEGFLLLRPWNQRAQPWDLNNGYLDAFEYSQNLFFDGHAYRVDCSFLQQDEKPRFKISFREKEVQLGELKLTGEFIDRLVLTATRKNSAPTQNDNAGETQLAFTVVLDRPGTLVKVPVGEYRQSRVLVKSGGTSAYNDSRYGSAQPTVRVTVGASNPPALAIGGPLTNSVSVGTRDRQLSMSYQLVGGGGETYQLTAVDRSRPPKFRVYKDGKVIHSGQFEFG